VTTVDPRTTLALMRQEIQNLQEGWITPRGLEQLVQQFITEYFLDNETNASQADFLARSQLYQGDYRRAMTFVQDLKAVTPEAVQSAARKYFRNIHWAYLGDVNKVNKGLLEAGL
jgi:zinc protease